MSLNADTQILEQLKAMREENAQFRQLVLAELDELRAAVNAKAVKTTVQTAIPAGAVRKPVNLPKFMTRPSMGEPR